MPYSLRHVFSHSLIYIFFDATNKAIPFLLLPYLTHRLNTEEFGLLELFNTYVALLVLIIMFGIDGWCSAHFHKLDKGSFSQMLRLGLYSVGGGYLTSNLIVSLLYSDLRFLFAPSYALCMCLIQLRAILYRFELKTIKASMLLFLNASINSLITIGAFEITTPSFNLRLASLLLPAVLLALFSINSLISQFPNKESLKIGDLKQMWAFTLPLLPNGLINFIRFGADKIFVAKAYGITQLALFSVGYQFAMVANIFMLSINQAIIPFMMSALSREKTKEYVKISLVSIAAFSFALIFIYLITPELLLKFFDYKYSKASEIAQSYYISYPLIFATIATNNILFFHGKTGLILINTCMSASLHGAILLYIYKNSHQIFDIPLALAASSALSIILAVFFTTNEYRKKK